MTVTVDLLAELDRREQQVQALRAAYAAAMARDGATYWIAEAARALRNEHNCLMVEVAARLRASEPKISRFERHKSLPEDLDDVINAYAEELEVDPIDIWRRALDLWAAAGTASAEASPGVVAGAAGPLLEGSLSRPKKARVRRTTPPAVARHKTA